MYRTWLRNILFAGGLIAVFILQYSVVPLLPGSFQWLQLPLVAIIGLYLLQAPVAALYAALGLGFLLDAASPQPFGTYMVVLLLCTTAIFALLRTVVTNRSLYSFLALTAVGSLLFMLIFALIGTVTSFFNGTPILYPWMFYVRIGLLTALWHGILIGAGYYLHTAWYGRFA